jgi:hypothetical protein
MLAHIVIISGALTFDEILAIIALVVNSLQAVALPVSIYLLAVQTRAMRVQTTALVEQSNEMSDIWEAWEEYMGKMLSETRLR